MQWQNDIEVHELRHAACRRLPRGTTAAKHHRPAAGSRAVVPRAGSARFCLLQIDVEVEEPETSENPTKSFEAVISADRCQGGGKQGSSGIHSGPTIPFSMSWFITDHSPAYHTQQEWRKRHVALWTLLRELRDKEETRRAETSQLNEKVQKLMEEVRKLSCNEQPALVPSTSPEETLSQQQVDDSPSTSAETHQLPSTPPTQNNTTDRDISVKTESFRNRIEL
ncbi:unnamed protein product [Boreogadus saida]